MPPIHDAAKAIDRDELKRLVQSREADINEKNADGFTALHIAAQEGHFPMLQWMVEEGGADVAARNHDGYTALKYAVRWGYTNIASWLLHKGGADITDIDNNGQTVWDKFKWRCEIAPDTPQPKVDFYSVLRCFGSPAPTSDAFIASIGETGNFTPAHRDLLL